MLAAMVRGDSSHSQRRRRERERPKPLGWEMQPLFSQTTAWIALCCVALSLGLRTPVDDAALPLWPLPSQVDVAGGRIALGSGWKCVCNNSAGQQMVLDACERYRGYLQAQFGEPVQGQQGIDVVHFDFTSTDVRLKMETNETYSMKIDDTSVVRVFSQNVFGALRALETFSQLVSENFTVPYIVVKDYPRFQHRELLVDTARYYFNVSFLEHVVDAMSFSKFNVLHWHAIDSQSFPVESKAYPLLAEKGQFKPDSHFCASSKCTYSESDIRGLVEYANARGVRVVLEVDTPGHSKSWGAAYKNMTVNFCTLNADSVPLDPTNMFAQKVVAGFVNEMVNGDAPVVPDSWVHLGGDEVDVSCWQKDKSIAKYMEAHNLTTSTLLSQWIGQIREAIGGKAKHVMYWEDAFAYVTERENTIFLVWKDKNELLTIARAGSQTVLSAGWYIHAQSKWTDFYDNEPFNTTWTSVEKQFVKGGAVSFWGCSGFCPFPFTAAKFDPRTWPVAAAAAERLWSAASVTDHKSALQRLAVHTKRLAARGVHVGNLK